MTCLRQLLQLIENTCLRQVLQLIENQYYIDVKRNLIIYMIQSHLKSFSLQHTNLYISYI